MNIFLEIQNLSSQSWNVFECAFICIRDIAVKHDRSLLNVFLLWQTCHLRFHSFFFRDSDNNILRQDKDWEGLAHNHLGFRVLFRFTLGAHLTSMTSQLVLDIAPFVQKDESDYLITVKYNNLYNKKYNYILRNKFI